MPSKMRLLFFLLGHLESWVGDTFHGHGRAAESRLTLQGNRPTNKQTEIPIVLPSLARISHSAVDLGLAVWDYRGQGTNRSGCQGSGVHNHTCLAEKAGVAASTRRDKNKERNALFLALPHQYNLICNILRWKVHPTDVLLLPADSSLFSLLRLCFET